MTTDPRQLAQEALALDTAAQDAHPSTPVGALAQLQRLGRLYDMCQPLATALLAALDERDAYRKAKQENDERFMLERDEARRERDELRLTLAAEQGRAEGAPSEGWIVGRPVDYPGRLDVRWSREVTPRVHVVVAWTGTGWIWRHFRGAIWLPWHYRQDPEVASARAAMLAADAATAPCAGPAPASTASPPTGT